MNSTARVEYGPPQKERGSRIIVFFLLTFAITWPCFILVARMVPLHSALGQILVLAGTFSPSFVAVWLTSRMGNIAVAEVLSRALQWRVAMPWYLFVALRGHFPDSHAAHAGSSQHLAH